MSTLRSLVVVAVLLAAAGCTDGGADGPSGESTAPVVQLGAPGEDNRTLAPDEIGDLTPAGHDPADVEFARAMLVHHAQAVAMTALVPDRADSGDVTLISERMAASQEDEITQLEGWLVDRGEAVPSGGQGHGQGHEAHADMPGMLTEEEIEALADAEGAAFDRQFLELMTRHHEGALTMVAELYAAGGGQEAEIGSIARHVDSDQRIEIARMADLLAQTPPAP